MAQQWEHAATDRMHSKSRSIISSVARKTASSHISCLCIKQIQTHMRIYIQAFYVYACVCIYMIENTYNLQGQYFLNNKSSLKASHTPIPRCSMGTETGVQTLPLPHLNISHLQPEAQGQRCECLHQTWIPCTGKALPSSLCVPTLCASHHYVTFQVHSEIR